MTGVVVYEAFLVKGYDTHRVETRVRCLGTLFHADGKVREERTEGRYSLP